MVTGANKSFSMSTPKPPTSNKRVLKFDCIFFANHKPILDSIKAIT